MATGPRRIAGKRGDIDDPAEFALHHARQHLVHKLDRRGVQYTDKCRLIFPARIEKGAGKAVAGIVDQRVNIPARLFQLTQDRVHALHEGKVLRDRDCGDLVLFLKLPRERIQPVEPPCGQCHIPAFRRILASKLGAETCRCARDQCQPVIRHLQLLPHACARHSPW